MGKLEELLTCVKSGNSSAGRKLLEKLKSGVCMYIKILHTTLCSIFIRKQCTAINVREHIAMAYSSVCSLSKKKKKKQQKKKHLFASVAHLSFLVSSWHLYKLRVAQRSTIILHAHLAHIGTLLTRARSSVSSPLLV